MTENVMAGPVETESSGNRKALLAGALAAAVALAGGGYFLLSGGSSSDEGGLVPHAKPVSKLVGKKPATRTAAKAPRTTVVPAATTTRIGRDPFIALYVQPASTSSGAGSTSTATGSTSTTTTAGSDTTDTAKPTSYPVTLVSISGGTGGSAHIFTWSYAGSSKRVIAAQKFGKYGELVTLTYVKNKTGKAIGAILQVGDDDPVVVAIGEKITVL